MIKTIQDEVKKRFGLNSECWYDEEAKQYILRLFNVDEYKTSICQKIYDLANELIPSDNSCTICPLIYNREETREFFPEHTGLFALMQTVKLAWATYHSKLH